MPLSIARDLVRCPSVTPADAGALGVLENILKAAGFEAHRVTFGEPGTADIDNLYARIGDVCPAHHFRRAYRRGAAGRRERLEPWRVLGRGERRPSVRARRGRHEGRHRLQRRGGAGVSCREWRPAKGLDLVFDHRRRGRHFRQRHHQALAMGGGARREVRPLRARRALQCRGVGRLHQGRPPRLTVGHALCRRRPGPRRLSASRREPGAGYFTTDRGARATSRSITAARSSRPRTSNSPRSMSATPRAT